jgi:L-amino acid N-acyltransferase YncA
MPASSSRVRQASSLDAAACLAIYRPYVVDTAISWELDVPTVDEMADRITSARDTHEWLVLESGDRIIGFAYAHAFNRYPAYQWSAQIGLYVDDDHHRCGGGRKLYSQLLARLAERGYRRAFAAITQPNHASNELHRAFGFQEAGLYRRIEWKHDRWHDVAWMQLDLDPRADQDDPPGKIV